MNNTVIMCGDRWGLELEECTELLNQCCTRKTNITLYVNYASINKQKKEVKKKNHNESIGATQGPLNGSSINRQ